MFRLGSYAFRLAVFAFVLVYLLPISAQELTRRPQHEQTPVAPPLDVISHSVLTPTLRGAATLRFSPDGNFLIVQDAAGLFLVQRNPLSVLLYVNAPDAYPAQFSSDSRTIALLSRQYDFVTWQLPGAKISNRREWHPPNGCLDSAVSPGTLWLACLSHSLTLNFYSPDDLALKFSESMGVPISAGRVTIPFSIGTNSPFSAPFGFLVADSLDKVPDGKLFHLPAVFSPEGSYFVLRSQNSPARFDLPAFQKTRISGSLKKNAVSIIAILPKDLALLADKKDPLQLQVAALNSGELLPNVRVPAKFLAVASDPAYALINQPDTGGVDLFDIPKQTAIPLPPNLAADVLFDVVTLLTAEGELRFYRLGEAQPFIRNRLPLNDLSRLHAALTDPSLSTLALSISGHGAFFDVATGKRLEVYPDFNGITFSSSQSAILLQSPQKRETAPQVSQWTASGPATAMTNVWTPPKKAIQLSSGTGALLEYSFFDSIGAGQFLINQYFGIDFALRGLESASGRELWQHTYLGESPVPFNDPQGSRFVLGWKANSDSAKRIARSFPSSRSAYKTQKIKNLDSFFEVVDSVTGNSLGGILIQFGSGPSSFDSAFSCGDMLFLVRDSNRIALFNLQSGQPIARVRGQTPACSTAAKLFVAGENGKLGFYDLHAGTKLAERKFPDGIAYTRFSETGDRLLVLTVHQEVFVLDVKKVLQNFAVAPSADPTP
jgi:hypothetical protein